MGPRKNLIALEDKFRVTHDANYLWAYARSDYDVAAATTLLEKCYASCVTADKLPGGRSLMGIAADRAASRRRRRAWRRPLRLDWDPFDEVAPSDLASAKDDDERASYVRAALKKLPAQQRLAVELAHLHQRSVAEAAEVAGVSEAEFQTLSAAGLDAVCRGLGIDKTDESEVDRWLALTGHGLDRPAFGLIWSRARERDKERYLRGTLVVVGSVVLVAGLVMFAMTVTRLERLNQATLEAHGVVPQSVPAANYFDKAQE